MKTEDICSYFEQYGEIESVGITIRFKDKTDANKVLQRRHHKVGNYVLTAETPRALPKNNDYKLAASSQKHILDLDDKILKKIGKYLKDKHLGKMSATCVRFKKIANQIFGMKYQRKFKVDLRNTLIAEAADVLKPFGAMINTMTLTSEFYERELFHDDFTETEMPAALKLAADYCGKTLRELRVNDDVHTTWSHLSVNYPKLERLYWVVRSEFASDYDRCECPNLSKFLSPLPNLRELTCTGYLYLKLETLIEIVENCPNLEKFCYRSYYEELKFTEEMMTPFCKLKSLKCLEILCYAIDLGSFTNELWKGNIPLERIVLNNIHGNDNAIIRGLLKLKRLKTLKMPDLTVKFKHLSSLSKSLPLLEELEISLSEEPQRPIDGLMEMLRDANKLEQLHLGEWDWQGEISPADYQRLANIVKKRGEKRKLSIDVSHKIDLNRIDADTIQRNREWIAILNK